MQIVLNVSVTTVTEKGDKYLVRSEGLGTMTVLRQANGKGI